MRKKLVSFLPVLAAALVTISAQGAGAAQAATSVKVMTWNWEIPKHHFYQRGWTNVVKSQQPDILGLQEICVKWVQQLVDDLKNEAGVQYDVVNGTWRPDRRCGGTPGTEGANGDAILVKRKTGAIVGGGSFRLPAVAGSKDQEERGVVWAKVRIGGKVDFNSTPGDSALRPMWRNGWREADRIAGNPTRPPQLLGVAT